MTAYQGAAVLGKPCRVVVFLVSQEEAAPPFGVGVKCCVALFMICFKDNLNLSIDLLSHLLSCTERIHSSKVYSFDPWIFILAWQEVVASLGPSSFCSEASLGESKLD